MHLGQRQEQEKLICLYIGQMKIQAKLDMYFASLKKKKKKILVWSSNWIDPEFEKHCLALVKWHNRKLVFSDTRGFNIRNREVTIPTHM